MSTSDKPHSLILVPAYNSWIGVEVQDAAAIGPLDILVSPTIPAGQLSHNTGRYHFLQINPACATISGQDCDAAVSKLQQAGLEGATELGS